ncbi:DNA-binding protein [Yersinia frederiksenii]|nr:DNA-binding protein [Yersinia frederiksenii]
MRNVDESCIAEVHEFKPDEIKQLRERFNISQPIFSRYLNINVSTIQKWENGAKHPNGLSLKLLSIVQKYGINVLM